MYKKEDVEKLISNRCSLEESTKIILFLDQNPEILANYFSVEDWESYKHSFKINKRLTNKLWHNIKFRTIKPNASIFYLKKLSIAAAIAIILGTGFWNFVLNKNVLSNGNNRIVSNFTKIYNESKITKTVILPDSSVLVLYPNSFIVYDKFKFKKHRDVKLTGECIFSVKKDSLNPFIVQSDVISTKVLGTKFRVQSNNLDNFIKITLYEGKVVVDYLKKGVKSIKTKFYMIPGDIFEYNKITTNSSIRHNVNDNSVNKKNTVYLNSNWYMFNNQKLTEVLDQLEVLYDEKIEYNTKDLEGMTFIGKLEKTDSLQHILNSICLLNNLLLHKEVDGFKIVKKTN